MSASSLPPEQTYRPVVLCILDGWGHRTEADNNAIAAADTPVWDGFMATRRHALLDASAEEVGLPTGQMGNSEVGHMNIGAGRIVRQDLPRIDDVVAAGQLAALPAFKEFVAKLEASGGRAHLTGLVSPGGVHAHQSHIAALARALASAGVPVVIHALLDGRDTPPQSALEFLEDFAAALDGAPVSWGMVSGRYYAMDRDKRWDRVARAWRALVQGEGEQAANPMGAVRAAYDRGETDEFVLPTVIEGYAGIADGDGFLMANFRSDRARQLLSALLDPDFDGFARDRTPEFAAALGMVEYSRAHNQWIDTLFPPVALDQVIGQVVADAGLTQLRIAETEKYAHVTFFLNGGEEEPFAGEERILVPSPKVATYDLQPEMSAFELTDQLVGAVESRRFDLIVVNYANTDMVGHTGDFDAAIRAVATVDQCLGRLDQAVAAAGGVLLITADHGNAEQMRDPSSSQPHTAHTNNPVPVVLAGAAAPTIDIANGRLADVAPTVLTLMGLDIPGAMTGACLLTAPASHTTPTAQTATADAAE